MMNVIMIEWAVRLAGVVLLLIAVANIFAPKKLNWVSNLAKTEPFFQQVFIVHAVYIVGVLIFAALTCLMATDELIAQESFMAKSFCVFFALFWGARVVLQFTYYDRGFIKQNLVWSLVFGVAFAYLAGVFLLVIIR